ncbi:hypothetical protein LCGC14_1290720 [marine sediment metagenome]|uniref:Uncharacterized protein n=1 Tax=marine sediment metagenome TaxID=412755 RepID=A0A0F9NVH8_9ZZZZ
MSVKKINSKDIIVIDPKDMKIEIDNDEDKTAQPWDLAEALRLRIVKHFTFRDLERYYGVHRTTIHTRMRRFQDIINVTGNVEQIQNMKTHLLTLVEFELLQDLLDKGKRKSASLNNTAYAIKQVFDMNRLEQNKATEIVDMRRITADLTDFLNRTADE